jgi:starch synthase
MRKKLNILIAASEIVPFAKTGGLADVMGALPKELETMGHNIKLVMPRYYNINIEKCNLKPLGSPLGTPMGSLGEVWCGVYEGKLPDTNISVYFLYHEQFFGRTGLYNNEGGEGFLDNDNRFAFFSKACLQLCKMLDFKPDIVHVNDWQTAAIPVFINTTYKDDPMLKDTATLLTIHNMQHQGNFYPGLMDVLDIGWEHFNFLELEFNDQVNLLKGGIYHSTQINTVSKGYANEIQTPEFGWGLEDIIKERSNDLSGIVNGIDYNEWNPETDKLIAANYSINELTGKAKCKQDLQKMFGLRENPDVPVIGFVSRLVRQKGIDVLAEALYKLLDYDMQLVILGTGEVWSHFYFGEAAARFPDKIACHIGYDNTIAHKIEAGSDFFLMPSRFEPCGLNQLYSLSYGTLPIVRATGGLEDTIESYNEETDTGTGFKFYDLNAKSLYNSIGWAIYTYYNKKESMQKLIKQAMSKRFTWQDSAKEYENLYYKAVKMRIGDEKYSQFEIQEPKIKKKSSKSYTEEMPIPVY